MTDTLSFSSKAELSAWIERQLIGANKLPRDGQMALLKKIRAVTDANSQLWGE